jgi:hypothetical protein
MGFSQIGFHRFKEPYETGGEISRKKPIVSNSVDTENELKQHGAFISR